jgi:hypothetical protein
MPNPIRAARKEGRKMVKETRQGVKAAKVTEKFKAKAEKIKAKTSTPAAAKSPSESVSRIEPRGTKELETKKAEIVKASPANLGSTATKKSSSAKKPAAKKSSRSFDKKDSATARVEQDKREKMERAISRKTVEQTMAIRDKSKAEAAKRNKKLLAAAISTVSPKAGAASLVDLDSIKERARIGLRMGSGKKAMGGPVKPSYKKGGYMMNTKKKKK